MAGRQLTPFEHILLGLICRAPASGYDLKRIFAVTPMGLYQPSSGALYPALRRLELKGLIHTQASADERGQSARHRRVYEPTQTGQTAHVSWLRTPIQPATAARDLGLHLMRFVMMEHLLSAGEVLTFLQDLAGALAALTTQLEQYSGGAGLTDRHPRLAIAHGLAVHRASLRWAEDTIEALRQEPVGPAAGGAGPARVSPARG
jgi:DNA-binding PadR family transcriptional regulator